MANPRPAGRMWPSKLFNAALVQYLKNRYFGTKSIRSLEKVQFLALKVTIFLKCGPRADLGWPWLSISNQEVIFKGISVNSNEIKYLKLSILDFFTVI